MKSNVKLLSLNATPEQIATAIGTGKISISRGANIKMGEIPSISLPPFTTCRKNAPCCKECYVNHFIQYPSIMAAYNRNLAIYLNDPAEYFRQIDQACKMFRFFRWHISGDIPNDIYLLGMITIANRNPHCKFLAFTKQYEIVNEWIDHNPGTIPENLTIVLSNWFNWQCENPHNLPTTTVYNPGDEIPDNWKVCSGNCMECCCRGIGCWELKPGEILAFKKH